jgi:hypothetical protein
MTRLALVLLVGCAHTDGLERDELTAVPTCDALPATRPTGVVMRVIQVDGHSLERTLDAALVADAACPTSYLPPSPACVQLADDAMDYVWRELRALKPHEIAVEPHGPCIHCGGATISVTWPTGSCERGMGHHYAVASASYSDFTKAAQLFEAAAAAGGVVARASSPR